MAGAVPALLLAFAPATQAAAQEVDQGWRALTGCWETAESPRVVTLCVVPTEDPAVVELVSISDDAIVERERIEATGERIARVREGCTGWEQAEWSADGRRLYTRSEHECEGGIQRTSSGISSVLPTGEWLNVQGIEAAGGAGVRALRYRPAATPAIVREQVESARLGRELAFETARVAIAGPIAHEHVVDATRNADEAVVEAWLIEGGASFDLNGARLLELARAGVPGSVIDVMVALSYPQVFAIDGMRGAQLAVQETTRRTTRPAYGMTNPWFGGIPFGYSIYPGFYSSFGFNPYLTRFGYSPYGFGYPGFGWYGQRPIVVVRDPQQSQQPQGRLVRGEGYTRPGSSGGSGASSAPRSSSGTSSTATTSRSGGSSTSSTSGTSSSSGSSGSTRTAQPRQ